ncbi:uncharacterized protein Z518_04622 [Rhinocladiella mackenziei CBS 650.93]|uniref:NAD(P)-binding protein n=1 Tax=Rhinocladiella mackenziei CBS 650.93 TaxID=1442369 RepID=A0A0D2ITZ5_9EURO|nr:uncharacterized protein Z518_04622 [Rhinocladiella mackenziei CBS 650.93]KIX06646.1 hypothetical protein Z518_04622 [Rhinocladiella mackenziei CBS 650.93]
MSSDSRLDKLICWTQKQHTSAAMQPLLDPKKNKLSTRLSVCVIGSSTGIGEHVAYAYAAAGVGKLLICSRTEKDLAPVKERITSISPDTEVVVKTVDIASTASVQALAEYIKTAWGRLDICVLNAGWSNPNVPFGEALPADIQRAFEINTLGTYNVGYFFIPILLASEGGSKAFLVIGSGSAAGRRGLNGNTGYSISKMAQCRMIEYMDETFASQGLTVIGVQPGTVVTRMSTERVAEEHRHFLTDDVGLAGAFCVWISGNLKDVGWMGGRLIFATWDLSEVLARKDEIVEKDLMKFAMLTE